jgi:hypothetical protein
MDDLSFLNIFLFLAFQMLQHLKMILPFEFFDVDVFEQGKVHHGYH